MATSAFIGIENKDGSVDYSRSRFDGNSLGWILLENYSDRDKLSNLIKHGEIWHLGSEVDLEKTKKVTKEYFKSDEYTRIGQGLTFFTYGDWFETGVYPDYFFRPDDFPTWEECKHGHIKDCFFFKECFKGSWAYLYTKHNEWWVSPYSDYKNRKWIKLEDYLKEDELEELFLDSFHVCLRRELKFSTFPELDSNLNLKEEFFDWALELLDLRDAKEYLENFPYSKMKYFKNLCDLKNFAFDFFKDKDPSFFEDPAIGGWFEKEDKSLTLKGVETLCRWNRCKLFGNEKIGFLFFNFDQYI